MVPVQYCNSNSFKQLFMESLRSARIEKVDIIQLASITFLFAASVLVPRRGV